MTKGDVEEGSLALSLKAYPGDDMASRIQSAVSSAPVVVFGKEHCPFCIEVRRLFKQLGVQALDFNVDIMPDGGQVWDALKKMHAPQKTVPYVYVNKVMVGGCDSTLRLQAEGELAKMLRAAGVKLATPPANDRAERLKRCGVLERGSAAGGAMFHFPEVLDNRAVRLNGFWTVVICILVAVFFRDRAAHWVMGGLMVEYAARLLGGGNASALGSLTAAVIALLDLAGQRPTKFVAGPPKQFATLCGLMFSGLAFFFYLVGDDHETKLRYVGLSVTCALGVAALLEAAIDFCLGCWMFGIMIQLGLVPDTVYQTYIESKAETEYTYNEMLQRLREGKPRELVVRFDEANPVTVDYKYKTKTDDMTKEDFHPIKHVKLTHFVMHLGFIGLACAWNAADPAHTGINLPASVWNAIGIACAIWYFIWVVLYLLKIMFYPRKVCKEIAHNINGSCFALPWVCLVLFAYLERDRDPAFAKALFWIGAPTSLLLSFIWVGSWVALKKELEHVNASWMMMPVGNFVAAAVGPMLDSSYRDAMQLWFAFALLMWLALFTITLYKAFVMPDYDDRVRPMLAVWVAAPAIGAVAYMSCYGPSSLAVAQLTGAAFPEGFNDFIFINLHWMAVAMALVLGVCFCRPYFGRMRFDMSYWAAGFPSAALCMCAITYNALKPGDFSEAIAYATLFFTSWLHATLLMQTFGALLRGAVFSPDPKWGPLSFMRLTHEAIRGVLPGLVDQAKGAAAGEEGAMEALRVTWATVRMVHGEHGRHEDDVIFPAYNAIFPAVSRPADEEHHALEAHMETVDRLLAPGAPAAEVGEAVAAYAAALSSHLRTEEDHLQAMPRKYVPLAMARRIVTECWDTTPAATWHTLLPVLVESMPMLHQRVRFVKTLLWAMPERCHQLGLMLATGCSAVHWRRIAAELPELVPRGAAALWERYY